jgi:hypothetical protein
VEEEEEGAAEALLRFMYTGGLEPAVAGSASELLRLLRLADRFQVGAAACGWGAHGSGHWLVLPHGGAAGAAPGQG